MPKNLRVRNRTIILILLPVMILLWLIGWTLFATAPRNTRKTRKAIAETETQILTGILTENHKEYAR